MLEKHLTSPITRQRLQTGAAAEHIDAFADWLHLKGYKPTDVPTEHVPTRRAEARERFAHLLDLETADS